MAVSPNGENAPLPPGSSSGYARVSTTGRGLDAQYIARIYTAALTESGHPARVTGVTDDPTRGLVARTGTFDEPALARNPRRLHLRLGMGRLTRRPGAAHVPEAHHRFPPSAERARPPPATAPTTGNPSPPWGGAGTCPGHRAGGGG